MSKVYKKYTQAVDDIIDFLATTDVDVPKLIKIYDELIGQGHEDYLGIEIETIIESE